MMYRSDHYSKVILSVILTCICTYSSGQITGSDAYKKELWKVVDPANPSPFSGSRQSTDQEKNLPTNNKYIRAYENYKNNSSKVPDNIFQDKYTVSPNLTIYNGSQPLNQMPRGSTAVVFMGGHFMFIPVGGKLVKPSGISLSGYNPKTLSEKSKHILRNVFGMEVED